MNSDCYLGRMKNFERATLSLSALLALAAFGCGSEYDDASSSEAEEELRTGGITSVYVARGQGFRPPPAPGSCHPSGHWTVDFTDSTLTGDACLEGVPTVVARDLSQAELTRVRAKVSALRTTRRPASCPTDLPVNSLEVRKASSSTFYVDQRAACGRSVNAIKETGLAKLVDVLEELSAVPQTDQCGNSCTGTMRCVLHNGTARCANPPPSP